MPENYSGSIPGPRLFPIIMSQIEIIEVIRRFKGPYYMSEVKHFALEGTMTIMCRIRRENLKIFTDQGWELNET